MDQLGSSMIELDRSSRVPLYLQIKNRLRDLILSGALPEGTQLPPERKLAATLGVTRGTVTNAYRELVADGLAEARVGRGTVVRRPSQAAASSPVPLSPPWSELFAPQPRGLRDSLLRDLAHLARRPDTIALTAGVPAPELYPRTAFHQVLTALLRDGDPAALGPCPTEGHPPLREAIARRMAERGATVTPEQVLVTTGSQQGLDLLARAFLEAGDAVVVEAPTYLGALQAFSAAGARLLSVPLDAHGPRLDILDGLLARHRPKLIYTLPTFQNPSGVTQDLERRLGLLAVAARYGIPVVEDDPYGPLYFDAPPPPPLKALDQQGSVIYLSTFSKIVFPGLRLGWIAAPRPVIERLARIKQRTDLYGNTLAQWTTAAFIEAGHLDEHLTHVRPAYRRRRDTMMAALTEHCPGLMYTTPAGGFNLWCRLPQGLKARALLAEAGRQGVVFAPGELFHADGNGEDALRLNFSAHSEAQIREAIARLGRAVEALQARSEEVPELERVAEPLV